MNADRKHKVGWTVSGDQQQQAAAHFLFLWRRPGRSRSHEGVGDKERFLDYCSFASQLTLVLRTLSGFSTTVRKPVAAAPAPISTRVLSMREKRSGLRLEKRPFHLIIYHRGQWHFWSGRGRGRKGRKRTRGGRGRLLPTMTMCIIMALSPSLPFFSPLFSSLSVALPELSSLLFNIS